MNEDTIMQTPTERPPACRLGQRIGAGLTGLVVLFLAFDGFTKVIRVAPVIEACQKMGISPHMAVGIGLLLLACTVVYVVPRTAILGAILLTGYLGGAAATHVLHRTGVFPTVFAVGFGALVWAGLVLREPQLIGWIFARRSGALQASEA